MKEILVIDVQMTEDGKHICNSCPVWDEKGCMCKYSFMLGHKGCPLKPMPQEEDIYEVGMDEEDTNAKRQWNKGWNACLKALEDLHNGEDSNE